METVTVRDMETVVMVSEDWCSETSRERSTSNKLNNVLNTRYVTGSVNVTKFRDI